MTATVAALVLAGCSGGDKEYDATGTFEATEVMVYAEQSGQLVRFGVHEGDTLTAQQETALIDTVPIALKISQLDATKQVYSSQRPDVEKQLGALRRQLEKARLEQRRYEELVRDGAAPRKMLDDAESQVQVLQRQLDAMQSSLSVQNATLSSQMDATQTQISQLTDQLRRCHVLAPITGTVLEKYVEQGELVATGKALYKLADTEHMFLRAYITSAQLQSIRVGQHVKVFADYGDNQRQAYEGTVAWISSRSEFTPKTIVTDDERADLVYAVKIAVKNDGYIKIGMYGEVKF